MVHRSAVVLVALLGLPACSLTARSPEQYRDDTRALLELKTPEIEQCYTTALRAFPSSEGVVTVRVLVENDTGKLTQARVDEARTTAPPGLGECVVRALDGLVLVPPDSRDADATLLWEFRAKAPPGDAAPAAPVAARGAERVRLAEHR